MIDAGGVRDRSKDRNKRSIGRKEYRVRSTSQRGRERVAEGEEEVDEKGKREKKGKKTNEDRVGRDWFPSA